MSAAAPDVAAAGSVCWLELATGEPERSMRFYETVLCWDYRRLRDSSGRDCALALLDGEPVAGVLPHPDPVRDWTPYLATPDLPAATETVYQLCGRILATPHRVPGVGATVLADDPHGATLGLAQPEPGWAFTAGVPGSLVWLEFITRHPRTTDRFYHRLFGYTQRQFGDGRTTDHMVYTTGGDSVLGRVRMDPGTPATVPPRWIAHFAVHPGDGFSRTLHRARAAGARLRFRPYTSTLGRIAVLSDPAGTRFALIDPGLAADWDHGSAVDDPYDD